jgi:hypothetical protein
MKKDSTLKVGDLNFYNALDARFSSESKVQIVQELENLIEKERAVPKIEYETYYDANSEELVDKFFPFFEKHTELINQFYPPTLDLVFNLPSKSFINKLFDYLGKLETAKTSDFNINDHKCDRLWVQKKARQEKINASWGSDKAMTYFILRQHPILKKLHNYIRATIKDNVNAPFSIVNTRAWVSKPNIRAYGPFKYHTDGFAPGHLKVMVYLTPLDINYGYLIIGIDANRHTIIDQPAGTCVLFRNSETLHKAVAGIKHDRIAIEITIQRTFVDLEQDHDGHPIGTHYSNLNTALISHSDDGKIIFRT